MLQEVMSQQLICGGSALDVDTQAHGKEGLELFAELLGLLETRRSVGGDEIQSLQWLFVQVWRLRLNHLNRHDTQRPNINLGAILFLLDNFWCHPVGRSHHGRSLRLGFRQLGTETEIGCVIVS